MKSFDEFLDYASGLDQFQPSAMGDMFQQEFRDALALGLKNNDDTFLMSICASLAKFTDMRLNAYHDWLSKQLG